MIIPAILPGDRLLTAVYQEHRVNQTWVTDPQLMGNSNTGYQSYGYDGFDYRGYERQRLVGSQTVGFDRPGIAS